MQKLFLISFTLLSLQPLHAADGSLKRPSFGDPEAAIPSKLDPHPVWDSSLDSALLGSNDEVTEKTTLQPSTVVRWPAPHPAWTGDLSLILCDDNENTEAVRAAATLQRAWRRYMASKPKTA